MDGNNANDELAKNLAEKVNEQIILAGIVPTGSNMFKIASENEEKLTYELSNNYPNPFNPVTRIKYEIANSENVKLKVYDILGKEVANLVDAQKEAGRYEILFDASSLASGIYFYRLQAGDFVQTRKMILLK